MNGEIVKRKMEILQAGLEIKQNESYEWVICMSHFQA